MPHVLIADGDNASMQRVATLLEHARYQVSRANDGRSALRVIDRQTPDLVLLEALLPDEEGFEICRRIRRTSDVPIVFHSTKARAEDRVRGLKLGADDYLSKPCPPAELRSCRCEQSLQSAGLVAARLRSSISDVSSLFQSAGEIAPIR